jgi:hypothetical protein
MKAQVLDIIRQKLHAFIIRREHAYKSVIEKGGVIPDYQAKVKAISELKTMLDASRDWSLQSNLKWIHAKREQINLLLPFEHHDDQKLKQYRERMLNLLRYCDDLLDTQPSSLTKIFNTL